MTTVTQQMQSRYATKLYDKTKKIAAADFEQLENTLWLSPTSMNIQPLQFVIADSEQGKARIAKAASGKFGFNAEKILDCSHAVVIASRVVADADYLEKVLEQEFQDGRYQDEDEKALRGKARQGFVDLHRFQLKDEVHWHAKQAYLALGSVLAAAAQLGIDSTAIEGIDCDMLDAEFGLREKGYATQVVVIFGYRHANDPNASTPKSRLPKADLIQHI